MRRHNTYSKKEMEVADLWLNSSVSTQEANKMLKRGGNKNGIYMIIACAERYKRSLKYEDD